MAGPNAARSSCDAHAARGRRGPGKGRASRESNPSPLNSPWRLLLWGSYFRSHKGDSKHKYVDAVSLLNKGLRVCSRVPIGSCEPVQVRS